MRTIIKPAEKHVDLHTHTTASDGGLSPTELVDLAIANQVEMLAITDHDTIEGYENVKTLARQRGLQLISGVEVSTTWSGQNVHIVGLNFDTNHPAIKKLLAFQKNARQRRGGIILDKLAKAKLPISKAELIAHVGEGQIGRPHIAQIMVAKGYASSVDKAFKRYLGAGKIGDVKNGWVSLADTVSAITHSGGVAVIAHPDKYKMTRSKLLRFIDEFIALGGQGIEVISSRQHIGVTEKYANIANEKGLCASLGSDFHYQVAYAPEVGQLPALPRFVTPIWETF